jgi:hypothetical protein
MAAKGRGYKRIYRSGAKKKGKYVYGDTVGKLRRGETKN